MANRATMGIPSSGGEKNSMSSEAGRDLAGASVGRRVQRAEGGRMAGGCWREEQQVDPRPDL
jgi:hypothetical protein